MSKGNQYDENEWWNLYRVYYPPSLQEGRQTEQGYPRLVWHHPSLLREIWKSDKFTENINESQQYPKRKI